ncbi:MAG TPA: PASTA domain-containing protein, partial [Bacillales bacterium]|nr:PASTA domain-containing protein [Bacillales bacterium]
SVKLLVDGMNFKDVEFRGVYNSDYSEGDVYDQEPDAGTSVVPGNTKLIFFYSKGPETVSVPDLSGLSKVEAENEIQDNGLVPEYQGEEYSDTVDEGEVSSQSPDPGADVEKGDMVNYTISKGPEPAPEPPPTGPEPQGPISFTQPITVEGPEKGKPVDVKIVYSDANHDQALYKEEKLKGTKTYSLPMTVEPDDGITVWVYENGDLRRKIEKSYDDIKRETSDGNDNG